MSSERIEELKSANPGSIISPEKYALAYELKNELPQRFDRIYGSSMKGIRARKGVKLVGIFAHEVSLFPEKGMPNDIAFDLKCAHDFQIERGEVVKVLTGVHLQMPDHTYASIRGRSGLSLKGIDVLAGVIDPQYRGEIGVTLTRTSSEWHHNFQRDPVDGTITRYGVNTEMPYHFSKGDRIAQLIFVPHSTYIFPIFEMDKIQTTDRGDKGYGSTGLNTR